MSSATLDQCINRISSLATRISQEASTPEVVQELQQCLETLIEVKQLNEELELCVQKRTAELSEALAQLQAEMTERRQLQAERSRLLAIVQASADYIGIADERGNVLWTNPQLQETRGLSAEADVTHFHVADYHPPWALDIIQQQGIPTALREGVWVGETVLLDKHEREIPVSQMIIAHKSSEGTVDYFSTVMRDIRELKKSQQRKRNLDINWEITQMLGYTPEEIQAMGQELALILMHPDDLVVSAGKMQEINTASDGEVIEFEYRLRHKNGEWRWLYSWDTVFTRNSEGKPTQIVGTATDISDRKHLELALQQSEERFRTCVENLLEPLALFSSVRDATGQIVDFRYEYINPAGCRVNRRRREEVIGTTMGERLSAHPQNELFDAYCQVVETGEPLIRESFCYEDVDAGEQPRRIFDIRAVKLGDGFVVTWQDITERKQAEAQIQTSLKEKDILLREIHHRVKNNLQVIHSLLRLQSSYTADPQTLQMFQDSQNRIRSMALIHEFLYNSQDLAQIDFGAYIQTLVSSLRRTYTVNQNAISWEIQVEPIQLSIDTALPCGLLINELISNALKYAFPAGQPGKIQINLHSDRNNQYTLVVKDDGVGLPSDIDFRNTDSLGLQLVCDSTAQLGGKMEIDRTHGTSFTIHFSEVKYPPRK